MQLVTTQIPPTAENRKEHCLLFSGVGFIMLMTIRALISSHTPKDQK